MESSFDTSFDITAEVIESTPIEKCSLNPRRGRNSRRLLTGFIIYASEVRKEVVDQYPDENFGFVSKLVGDKWRALSTDLRFKYHQRALIHNKRIKELAAREGVALGDVDLANGSVIRTPKTTKKKLAKLAKQEKRLNGSLSTSKLTITNGSSAISPDTPSNDLNLGESNDATATASQKPQKPQTPVVNHIKPLVHQESRKRTKTIDSSTQTIPIRFVEPPPKKPLAYSPAFLQHLQQYHHQQQQQQSIKTD
uniref:Non-histone chromosomal protein 6 n=1 Tax=Aceria tosichella TaxID=561515 RepID=A0A6G1SCU8_9ACAR